MSPRTPSLPFSEVRGQPAVGTVGEALPLGSSRFPGCQPPLRTSLIGRPGAVTSFIPPSPSYRARSGFSRAVLSAAFLIQSISNSSQIPSLSQNLPHVNTLASQGGGSVSRFGVQGKKSLEETPKEMRKWILFRRVTSECCFSYFLLPEVLVTFLE